MPRLIIKRYISLLYLSLILLISIGIELPNQPHHSYMNITINFPFMCVEQTLESPLLYLVGCTNEHLFLNYQF